MIMTLVYFSSFFSSLGDQIWQGHINLNCEDQNKCVYGGRTHQKLPQLPKPCFFPARRLWFEIPNEQVKAPIIPIWNQLGWKKNWKMSPRSQYLQLFKCRVRMFLQSLHRVDLYWSFLIVTLMLLNVIDLYLAKQYQKSVNLFVSGKTWRQTCYDALRLFPHVF